MNAPSRTFTVIAAIISFAVLSAAGYSQTGEVIRSDPYPSPVDFVPGEILVKFKDGIPLSPAKEGQLQFFGLAGVDAVIQHYRISAAERIFPNAQQQRQKPILKTYSGKTFERPNLHTIFRMKIADPARIYEAIEELTKDPAIEYAEPNRFFSIVDDTPVSENLMPASLIGEKVSTGTAPNDPYYGQQTYIGTVHADAVWDSTKGDSSQIIAILDTGVDWLHPDLVHKVWNNAAESGGVTGFDDDGNGLVDDVRGWDYINNDNDPSDDNSHGTHVAGIAAAEANNGIGIAGINWYAKILPVKVFQSSGRGDAATIAQGIVYAADRGATVINMSFGSYARSFTMEAALANAYAGSILVAAAGNDGESIYPPPRGPFYPAALSYVIGVQAGDAMGNAKPAGFSNYDPDGPVYSTYDDMLNYELRSPGQAILSTVPNGNYRLYSGTSMAAPIVSGCISLYRSVRSGESQELTLGNLINTSGSFLDIFSALGVHGEPSLSVVSHTIVDTLDGDDDGRVDAGETIEMWFSIRNSWVHTDSVFAGLRFAEYEDSSVAQILVPEVFIGSISSYASKTNEYHPLKIHINSGVANNRDIVFEGLTWYQGSPDTIKQRITVMVENGTDVGGIISSNTTWTEENVYLIKDNVRVATGVTLTISPGTSIIFYEGKKMDVLGTLVAAGTPDNMIDISGFPSGTGDGFQNSQSTCKLRAEYVKFHDINVGISINWGGDSVAISNCLFTNLGAGFPTLYGNPVIFEKNVLTDNPFNSYQFQPWLQSSPRNYYRDNVFVRNGSDRFAVYGVFYLTDPQQSFSGNSIFSNRNSDGEANLWVDGNVDYAHTGLNYWGRNDSTKIKSTFFDFIKWGRGPVAVVTPYLTMPTETSHGHVWKVLVNGKNPMEESMDVLGVGPARFDVYFNRVMDTAYTPQVTFGVREPFTQQAVTDSGHWSSDRKVWTVYKTIKLHTGDGINRIRVSGARDEEGFEIPVDDRRFDIVLDVAGTASTEFTAQAGLGKIDLEWNRNDLEDLLGFNMYRFTNVTDTTYSDTTLINTNLITDTLYTDFDVIPAKNYYYKYKVVRTDFSESDYSKTVGTQALTSSPGDGNGDLAVNVLDIVATVSYILGQNPTPFIMDAADINNDSTINVLDVVGIINIILHPDPAPGLAKSTAGNARLSLTGEQVTLTTDVPVSALQFRLEGKGLKDIQFVPDAGLRQCEAASNTIGDSVKIVIIYNVTGAMLGQGSRMIGRLPSLPSTVRITEGIVADGQGKNIITNVYDNGKGLIPEEYYLSQNYPNPFNLSTKIRFGLPERTKGKVVIYNVLGQRIKTIDIGEKGAGRYEIMWDGMNETGRIVSTGVYFYRFESNAFTKTNKMILIK